MKRGDKWRHALDEAMSCVANGHYPEAADKLKWLLQEEGYFTPVGDRQTPPWASDLTERCERIEANLSRALSLVRGRMGR